MLFGPVFRKKSYLCSDKIQIKTDPKTMTTLTIVLLIFAAILTLVGVAGSVIPALPGPPLSLAALAIVYWILPGTVSNSLLLIMTLLTAVAAVLDYFAPILITKVGGGSKQAILCTTVGLVAGLFFMPLGLILGPLVGAFVGEYSHSAQIGKALWIAFLSFLSFLITTVFKLILSAIMSYYIFEAMF